MTLKEIFEKFNIEYDLDRREYIIKAMIDMVNDFAKYHSQTHIQTNIKDINDIESISLNELSYYKIFDDKHHSEFEFRFRFGHPRIDLNVRNFEWLVSYEYDNSGEFVESQIFKEEGIKNYQKIKYDLEHSILERLCSECKHESYKETGYCKIENGEPKMIYNCNICGRQFTR